MQFLLKKCLSVFLLIFSVYLLSAQGKAVKKELPKNWYQLDKQKDGFYGISLEQAYEFLRSKKIKSKAAIQILFLNRAK